MLRNQVYFFSQFSGEDKELSGGLFRVRFSYQTGSYLGLPILWVRSKSAALAFVKEKVGMKL